MDALYENTLFDNIFTFQTTQDLTNRDIALNIWITL